MARKEGVYNVGRAAAIEEGAIDMRQLLQLGAEQNVAHAKATEAGRAVDQLVGV